MSPVRHRVFGRALRPVVVFALAVAVILGGVTAPATASPEASASRAPSAAGFPVKTANLAEFNPGNIISDAVFYNGSTMNEAQIQAFLNARVPRCAAGYTCLKDWADTPRQIAPDAMCRGYSSLGAEKAATIIAKVGQSCGINPQALIVMLQKEQGLITGTAPSAYNYRSAMGQGCPDTAACDTRYYGFFNQVFWGAWQLKRYGNPPGTSNYFTWYAPGKTWNVRWHPNAGCGSSPVYIQNQATASLYYYTPYQPNAAALRAGYGLGDGCSSYGNRNFYQYFTDWFGSTQGNTSPFGALDVVQAEPGVFRVAGWAADPETTDPIPVHIYVGGAGTALTAGNDRPDVGAAYPKVGSRHGFDTRVAATGPGAVSICAYGINVGSGNNALLGCATAQALSGSPYGYIDSIAGIRGGIQVGGWTIDPDTASSIPVHLYIDGVGAPYTARIDRADIARAYPAYGGVHGFSEMLGASPGRHNVCAFGINTGPGSNAALGCVSVVVPDSDDKGRAPSGYDDSISITGTTATVVGWAVDPDTVTAPVTVRVTVGSTTVEAVADVRRDDVARVFPTYGDRHGYSVQVPLPYGRSEVCVEALNTGVGASTRIGCRSVDLPPTASNVNRAPFGVFDSLTSTAGGAQVYGWAIDPDTTSPIPVHLYVDGVGVARTADKSRPDVAAVYRGYGEGHGILENVALTSGSHRVCAFAIDDKNGPNTALGCRDIVIP